MVGQGDEGELIRAAAAGSRAAFDTLVRQKREQVVRIAYQVTGDWDDALDIAQGVFLRLWKGLGQFDPSRRFDTWLYRITVNAAIDLLRSQGPKGILQSLPDDPAEPGRGGSLGDDKAQGPEQALDLAELRRAFSHLAGRLAPQQRTAFVLREIEGLDTTEVARIMNVADSTVRNHLLQARRILRAALERDYPGLVPSYTRGSPKPGKSGKPGKDEPS